MTLRGSDHLWLGKYFTRIAGELFLADKEQVKREISSNVHDFFLWFSERKLKKFQMIFRWLGNFVPGKSKVKLCEHFLAFSCPDLLIGTFSWSSRVKVSLPTCKCDERALDTWHVSPEITCAHLSEGISSRREEEWSVNSWAKKVIKLV